MEKGPCMEQKMTKRDSNKTLIAVILGMLAAMPPLCTDVYLPAFPAIARDLMADPSVVQGSLSSCFFGMAIGQILFGPLSDMKGRRGILLLSLLFFCGQFVFVCGVAVGRGADRGAVFARFLRCGRCRAVAGDCV